MLDKKNLTSNDINLLKKKYPRTYKSKIKKVKKDYPVQYLIGNVEFLNTIIEVNKNVLIPRFETEFLVEKVLNKLKNTSNLNILDLGTGSGCIAIALKKNLNCNVSAIDISKKALKVAHKNALKNNVNIKFSKLDILSTKSLENYDVYISNPPYINKKDTIDPMVKKHEPKKALFASNEGLEFYEKILKLIPNTPRLIAFEIGENQGKILMNLAEKTFPKAKVTLEKDLAFKDRYLFIEHF